MDWTSNDIIIQFIEEVRAHPVIWDSSHADYKNRVMKHNAIKVLAEVFNCDETEVMRKWKIILAQHRRERKKIADWKRAGIEYKPKWFGWAHLQFLKNEKDGTNVSAKSDDELGDQWQQDTNEPTENEGYDSSHGIPSEQSRVPGFQVRSAELKGPKHSLKRRRDDEDHISQALAIMNNVCEQSETRRDEEDVFAAGVAMKLRKIRDERTKVLVQRNIDILLYDAILESDNF